MKKYPIYLNMEQIKLLKDIVDDAFHEANAFNEAIELNCLDTRTRNCMRHVEIKTYLELSKWGKNDLIKIPNFGKNSLELLQSHVKQKFPNRWKEFKFLIDHIDWNDDFFRVYEKTKFYHDGKKFRRIDGSKDWEQQ